MNTRKRRFKFNDFIITLITPSIRSPSLACHLNLNLLGAGVGACEVYRPLDCDGLHHRAFEEIWLPPTDMNLNSTSRDDHMWLVDAATATATGAIEHERLLLRAKAQRDGGGLPCLDVDASEIRQSDLWRCASVGLLDVALHDFVRVDAANVRDSDLHTNSRARITVDPIATAAANDEVCGVESQR